MVKVEDLDVFLKDVQETFGFLLAQKIAESPITPKDSALMARSFPSTFQFDRANSKISFSTPFYTKYVTEGTRYMAARPFITDILNLEGEMLLKQAFKIVDKKYSSL